MPGEEEFIDFESLSSKHQYFGNIISPCTPICMVPEEQFFYGSFGGGISCLQSIAINKD